VTSTSASVIAAGVLPDGRHDLVVMHGASETQELIETKAGADFEFGTSSAWSFRARDATFVTSPAGFKTFALAEDGSVLVPAFTGIRGKSGRK
jgi:hypothetical protein